MKKRLQVKIFGTAQGVFFRHSAKLKADELGLKGFVRNEPDGSVHAEVEGEEADLETFLEWCRKGPPLANVSKVEFSLGEPHGTFQEFEIK